jgi:hypothetical protein
MELADFQISGGVICSHQDQGVIARYCGGAWLRGNDTFPILTIEGHCRMHFGITRNPMPISDAVGRFSLVRTMLGANGIPFAQYVEEIDMWRSLMRPLWWHSAHFVWDETVLIPGEVDTESLVNPWERPPSKEHRAARHPSGSVAGKES